MSWARTFVSTRITSPVGRWRACHRTATPVTYMARVASMHGAPRIAPTPTACDASPDANRIAMIGINVSGRAVPTAASTDPTAPSANPSLRPNHSMPLVNSSAPSRMMTRAPTRMRMSMRLNGNSEGASDADRDDDEDPDRDRDHQPVRLTGVVDAGDDHPPDGRRHDGKQPKPQERGRIESEELAAERRQVEARTAAERRDPIRDHQCDADDEQADGDVGRRDQQPADALLGRRGAGVGALGDAALRETAHVKTRIKSWTAV